MDFTASFQLPWCAGLPFQVDSGTDFFILFLIVLSSGGLLIPSAMLPDVIELDEALTGQRREGVFYSVFLIVEKVLCACV